MVFGYYTVEDFHAEPLRQRSVARESSLSPMSSSRGRRAASEAPLSSYSSPLTGQPFKQSDYLLPSVNRSILPLSSSIATAPKIYSSPISSSYRYGTPLPSYPASSSLNPAVKPASATPPISELRRRIESRLDSANDTSNSYSSGPVDFMTIRQYLRELNDKVTRHKTLVDRYAPIDSETVDDRYKQILEKMKSYNTPSSSGSASSSIQHRLNRFKRRTRYDY